MHIQEIADQNIPTNASQALRKLITRKQPGPVIGYLNINSIRNKFEAMKLLVAENTDILNISETKLDNTFAKEQFIINGFKTPIMHD